MLCRHEEAHHQVQVDEAEDHQGDEQAQEALIAQSCFVSATGARIVSMQTNATASSNVAAVFFRFTPPRLAVAVYRPVFLSKLWPNSQPSISLSFNECALKATFHLLCTLLLRSTNCGSPTRTI